MRATTGGRQSSYDLLNSPHTEQILRVILSKRNYVHEITRTVRVHGWRTSWGLAAGWIKGMLVNDADSQSPPLLPRRGETRGLLAPWVMFWTLSSLLLLATSLFPTGLGSQSGKRSAQALWTPLASSMVDISITISIINIYQYIGRIFTQGIHSETYGNYKIKHI